jgi:hypothetical protein
VRRTFIGAVAFVGAVLIASTQCNRSEPPPPAEQSAPAAALPPGKIGTAQLVGTVSFHGQVPEAPKAIKLSFPDCARFAPRDPPDPALVIGKSGGVASAFVWIKEGLPAGQYPVPSVPVRLDQRGCDFTPRVFGIRVGQPLEMVNSDPMLHNVKSPSAFNVGFPQIGVSQTRSFKRPGVMTPITCDVHRWMQAWAGVVTHPFFAVTDAEGRFTIASLPAGTYTVEIWQERLGTMSEKVTLADGESKTLAIELKRP